MFNDVYNVIKKNLILLIIVILAAAIAGAIFSSEAFMKPRFKSTAAVYPINTIPHSDESETEQMLQIFGSEDIKESVLNTFELWTRWEDLTPGSPEYNHWSNELYQERVSIGPTRFESVEIVCQDEDPEVAQKMAEHIIDKFNDVARQMDRDIHIKYFEMKEFELTNLEMVIDSVKGRMQELRMEGGLFDFESQSERVTEGYLRMLDSGGSTSKLDEVKALMARLAKDGSELEVLQEMVKDLNVYYTNLTQEHIQAKAKAYSNLDYASVVVAPQLSDKKSYPVRWIIVLLSMIMGGVAAIVFLILKERLGRQQD